MTSRRWQLVFATDEPTRTARFWRRALGYVPQPPPDGYSGWDAYAAANAIDLRHGTDIDAAVDPTGAAPRLLFVRDNPALRGSISIEILTGNADTSPSRHGLETACADLASAGARLVSAEWHDNHPWAQLRSPDDHPFRIQ
jgi:hypothetical protein